MTACYSACGVPTLGSRPRSSRHGAQPQAQRGRQGAMRQAATQTALASGDDRG